MLLLAAINSSDWKYHRIRNRRARQSPAHLVATGAGRPGEVAPPALPPRSVQVFREALSRHLKRRGDGVRRSGRSTAKRPSHIRSQRMTCEGDSTSQGNGGRNRAGPCRPHTPERPPLLSGIVTPRGDCPGSLRVRLLGVSTSAARRQRRSRPLPARPERPAPGPSAASAGRHREARCTVRSCCPPQACC